MSLYDISVWIIQGYYTLPHNQDTADVEGKGN